MPVKGLHTGSETTGRKTPQRARLSDITNTAPLSLSKHREDDHVSKPCDSQLHKEFVNLRKALAEKEELIKAQMVDMEKLWINYTKKTKQNEDIIAQNGRLSKDLMQARDRLKILQHENAQMASAHKVMKSELQAKLAKALEQVDLSVKTAVPPTNEKGLCDKQASMPNVLAKLAESRARRSGTLCETPIEVFDSVKQDSSEYSATCRSTLRRRASLSYKEPSLKSKLRQKDNSVNQAKPCPIRRESQTNHLYKLCEEEPSIMPIAVSCSSEENITEVSNPLYAQAAMQSKSGGSLSAVSDEGKGSTASFVHEENGLGVSLNYNEEPQMSSLEASSSVEELQSGRPGRRATVGSVISYKETPVNMKMRRT